MHRREPFRRAAVLAAGFAFRHSADVPSLDLKPDTRERIHKASTAVLPPTGHYEEAFRQIEGFRKRLWDP